MHRIRFRLGSLELNLGREGKRTAEGVREARRNSGWGEQEIGREEGENGDEREEKRDGAEVERYSSGGEGWRGWMGRWEKWKDQLQLGLLLSPWTKFYPYYSSIKHRICAITNSRPHSACRSFIAVHWIVDLGATCPRRFWAAAAREQRKCATAWPASVDWWTCTHAQCSPRTSACAAATSVTSLSSATCISSTSSLPSTLT